MPVLDGYNKSNKINKTITKEINKIRQKQSSKTFLSSNVTLRWQSYGKQQKQNNKKNNIAKP